MGFLKGMGAMSSPKDTKSPKSHHHRTLNRVSSATKNAWESTDVEILNKDDPSIAKQAADESYPSRNTVLNSQASSAGNDHVS
jgi:hypothetical protein